MDTVRAKQMACLVWADPSGDYSVAAYPPIFPGKNLKTKRLEGGNPTIGSTFRIANSVHRSLILGKTLFCVESDGSEELAKIFA